jgi:hypothetical protein
MYLCINFSSTVITKPFTSSAKRDQTERLLFVRIVQVIVKRYEEFNFLRLYSNNRISFSTLFYLLGTLVVIVFLFDMKKPELIFHLGI